MAAEIAGPDRDRAAWPGDDEREQRIGRLHAVFETCRSDDSLADEVVRSRILEAMRSVWPEAVCRRVSDLDPSAVQDLVSGLFWLDSFALSPNADRLRYVERLLSLVADYQVRAGDLGALLRMAEALVDGGYPMVVDAVDVTNGSGSSAIIHEATDGSGARVIVKTDRIALLSIHRADVDVVRGLEPYGGPAFLGEVAFFDRLGVMRYGVCMELVPGMDLQRLYSRSRRGEELPLRVTPDHLRSLAALERKLEAAGKVVSEVNRGDIMLRPDGVVVPLDMYVIEPRGDSVCRGLDVNGVPISTFIEDVIRMQSG